MERWQLVILKNKETNVKHVWYDLISLNNIYVWYNLYNMCALSPVGQLTAHVKKMKQK